MKNQFAPVVLFTYNRPWHTKQTLEALMGNEYADESILYIYCDGPKEAASDETIKNIKEVRTVIREKKWCKEVIIKERTANLGLANSVIQGVTEVIEKHGKVIVLEDDILTGKFFLKFMNEGLNTYEKEEKVYGVTGYTFPSTKRVKDPTYFLPIMSSWGYGTWVDKWRSINFNGQELLHIVETNNIKNKLHFGTLNLYQMLKDQVSGKNDSWAVRFYVSMFLNKGLFLFPNTSLLKNIGFDGTGVHCGLDISKVHESKYENHTEILIQKKKVLLQKNIIKSFEVGELKSNLRITTRFKRRFVRLFAPEIIQLVKRKFKVNPKEKVQSLNSFPRYTKTTAWLENHEIIIPDSASFLFMQKEIFNENIYKFKTSNPIPYIIDGGANIGLATIYLKRLFPFSKIIAFEPDPEIYKILESNIKVFNFTDVELVQKGLWDEHTTLLFKSEGADGGIIADVDRSVSATEKIEVISLRPYLKKTVDFLKLDIEGAETIVLKDIKDDLDKVQRIFIEYHSFVNQPQSLNEIIDILTKAKFRIHVSSPGLSSKAPLMGLNIYNNMDMQLNIYGFKNETI